MRPTIAKIDLTKLNNNIQIIKKQLRADVSLMAIVKANAYGHGAVEIARQCLKSGAFSLGVAIPEEGAQLRYAGIDCDILVLGGIDTDQIDLILDYNLSVSLFSVDVARLINERAKKRHKKVKTHIKIDSGMGRIGVRNSDEAIRLCLALSNMDNISIEGVFTHFACADQCEQYSLVQIEKFKNIIKEMNKIGFYFKWVHAANTASIFNYPKAHFDMVRAGIGMYGYFSQPEEVGGTKLEPVLSWHTRVVYLKNIDAGDSVSYGRTFIANTPKIVATLPVGYGDGYSRLFSNRGWVLIKGRKAPIIGNICMDQMMVDVTEIPNIQIGDEVVLIGKQNAETIFADDLAKLCGTIPYEILTNISSRVPRIYMEDKVE